MATSNDTNIKPDHVIIWLDENMSVGRNNRPSKIDLANNANVNCPPSNERSSDIDNFIGSVDENMKDDDYNDPNKSPLRMFIDQNKCIECIEENLKAKKQPFLITSGAMGASIVPVVYKQLSGYIYIFCGQRDLHTWTDEYKNDLEVYDDETGVFAKVLLDIGIYYMKKSDGAPSIQYLQWARRFVLRAVNLDRINREWLLQEINDRLASLDNRNNENDDNMAQDADEG
jgi:hypothetical protein